MIAFADTSAIVKLYVDEVDSRAVRSLEEPLVACAVARVELPAALWRKARTDALAAPDAQVLTDAFEHDWFAGRFVVVQVGDHLLDDAARLVAVHGLRAYDGVQLAAASAARVADPEVASFAALDDELRLAAAAEGLSLVPAAQGS